MRRHSTDSGFTLTELAIVLLIVALLIGGMLVPLAAQYELARRAETTKSLADIREALVGYAIIYGRLPCPMPATVTNPADAAYGFAPEKCDGAGQEYGYLPWKTLGLTEMDAWGTRRTTSTDPFNGYWRYHVASEFAGNVPFGTGTGKDPFKLDTPIATPLRVKDANGNDLTKATDPPVAVVLSNGPDLVGNSLNSNSDQDYRAGEPATGFDDMVTWIGRPTLFNRMVAAGKLP